MKKKYGFTLLELMVVVAIIGVLVAVAVPKFANMLEKTKEGATKGNISAIMSAIRIYYAENNEKWPDDISDESFLKYINKIPPVKVTHNFGGHTLSGTCNTVEILQEGPKGKGKGHAYGVTKFRDDTDGWRYDPDTGDVWVNNAQTDTAGVPYTLYGHQ